MLFKMDITVNIIMKDECSNINFGLIFWNICWIYTLQVIGTSFEELKVTDYFEKVFGFGIKFSLG